MIILLLIICLFTVSLGDDLPPEGFQETGEEPAYKVLYESGFYEQAIELLQTKIKAVPDSADMEYLKYLAFCFTATEQKDSAEAVFLRLLDIDKGFYLDTILTSPKILDVFMSAEEKLALYNDFTGSMAVTEDSLKENSDTSVQAEAGLQVQSDSAAAEVNDTSGEVLKTRNDWYSIPLCFVPLGVTQIQYHKPVRGILFSVLQVAGIGAGIWAYHKMKNSYDPEYGWYSGNRSEYERYSLICRTSMLIFTGVYAGTVADGLVLNLKSRKGKK
ncbi:MAG: tetratricopeptide repeat protein [Fibrobacter sp.]|jgi:tetratricopeptide (TPR) repeat protein|nr:tetratricopeptide repeat protein [Fibrobacter sp.]